MSKSLKGKFRRNIDTKGRLIIPSKLRIDDTKALVISRGLDNCLYIYTEDEWDVFMNKLEELGDKNDIRKLKRYFAANAEDIDMDDQGRIVVPSEYRDQVKIDKEVVVVGNINRIEIWSAPVWDELEETPEFSTEYISQIFENI